MKGGKILIDAEKYREEEEKEEEGGGDPHVTQPSL